MRKFSFFIMLLPILELIVLIKVGASIGVIPTVLLVICSTLLGGLTMRLAGISTAWKTREKISRGEAPNEEMLNGFFWVVAGFLLLLPGFITDLLGLLAFIPFVRKYVLRTFLQRMQEKAEYQKAFSDIDEADIGQAKVLEGEYEKKDEI